MTPLLLVLLAGCSGDDPQPSTSPTGDTGEAVACEELSWEGTGQPFVTTWCTACHASGLGEGDRFGAPLGVDFDRYDDVLAQADRVEARALGADISMPPVGGAEGEELARFARWIACGLPGPPGAEERSCAEAVSVAWSASVCDDGVPVRVDGDVQTGAVDASCVCEVGGALTLTGGDQQWPLLATVGGELRLEGAGGLVAPLLEEAGLLTVRSGAEVHLPRLQRTDGVDVTAPSLTLVDLHDLREVSGSVAVVGNPALALLDLSRLETVGGDLVLDDNDALPAVLGELYGLRTVGGDLRITGHALWQGFYGCGLLASIGGDLHLGENDRFGIINGFTALGTVGGSVRVVSNDGLFFLEGFDQLTDIGGELVVSGNPQLQVEDAFALLERVEGPLVVSGNPLLEQVSGLVGVHDVGGLVWSENRRVTDLGPHSQLEAVRGSVLVRGMGGLTGLYGFGQLESLDGSLTLEGNPAMQSVVAFANLRQVGQDLDIRQNAQLVGINGLTGVRTVGHDLRLVDNGALSESALAPWLAGVAVGGVVELSGNAP